MAGQDAIEPIRIDADLWSHRDLLERVVQRWFHIVEEMHDVEIGWEVTLNHQQDNADTALIVNEIGEIGLDHLIVEHTREDTVLLSNGCLCCAVQSNLVKTLRELLARRERAELPRYEVIESSGEAHCRTFKVDCQVALLAERTYGVGSSRRLAEQQAAQQALIALGVERADD